MRKLSKTLLSLLLIAAMLASFVVLPAAAEEPAAEQPTETAQAAETQADDAVKTNYELSIVMLDCGRKYFSVDSIKQIIDNASAAGFGYIMLGVGNDGMRFLLDDMSLAVNGTTYSSEKVAAAIKVGNKAYDASQTSYSYAPTTDELTHRPCLCQGKGHGRHPDAQYAGPYGCDPRGRYEPDGDELLLQWFCSHD